MTNTEVQTGETWLGDQVRHLFNRTQFVKALDDIVQGWRARELWGTMGLHDARQRYRRSFLGPFWITISMGIMVAALGLLYGAIFKLELRIYLPYLACGFVIWGLISGLIQDGTKSFISSGHLMRQLRVPVSIYVYRAMWSNLVTFAHNIWIYVFVAWWFDVFPGWEVLWALPGFVLLTINALWIGLLLGLTSARFRDIPLIVANVVQVMFFITPVIWKPSMLPDRALFLELNPFYHFMEILRGPLLGSTPGVENWLVAIAITLIGWGITLFFYTGYRWRLAYWV